MEPAMSLPFTVITDLLLTDSSTVYEAPVTN